MALSVYEMFHSSLIHGTRRNSTIEEPISEQEKEEGENDIERACKTLDGPETDHVQQFKTPSGIDNPIPPEGGRRDVLRRLADDRRQARFAESKHR